jgi:hypothetical protein
MMDDLEEIRFLREKAAQLRSLAHKYKLPPDNELRQIADDFERLAREIERGPSSTGPRR